MFSESTMILASAEPTAATTFLEEIQTVFRIIEGKFGTVNWSQLLVVVVPFIPGFPGDTVALLAAILANLSSIFPESSPSPKQVKDELVKSTMFANAA